ncbi:Hypothetical protein SMAX5B_000676 [Scophthalmus maximus]|uniref:Uncharacterized protein n=1 Tax=Scophthalmus maximus TaxID=52904 RepID=A0A2U9B6C7_SCOMX|nr:Hypothetical protein SMAX5B_000676 [Scophthalmus maximus]
MCRQAAAVTSSEPCSGNDRRAHPHPPDRRVAEGPCDWHRVLGQMVRAPPPGCARTDPNTIAV